MFCRAAARTLPRYASVTKSSAVRAISTTAALRSDAPVPQIYGPGGKAGDVPSDYEQATGLQRLQLLGDLEGIEVFDKAPLDATRVGTKKNPILVSATGPERLVGCTGYPADSHDVLWFPLRHKEQHRCVECGSVYALDFDPAEHEHTHAHH